MWISGVSMMTSELAYNITSRAACLSLVHEIHTEINRLIGIAGRADDIDAVAVANLLDLSRAVNKSLDELSNQFINEIYGPLPEEVTA